MEGATCKYGGETEKIQNMISGKSDQRKSGHHTLCGSFTKYWPIDWSSQNCTLFVSSCEVIHDISWTQMSLWFGWSTGWQGKSEGKSGGLGLVWFRSLSFHRHCHMLSRYFDGVTLGPSYVKDHYFDDEICHHFRPSDTVTRRPRGQLSRTSVTPASVDDSHLNHTHQRYRLFSNQ